MRIRHIRTPFLFSLFLSFVGSEFVNSGKSPNRLLPDNFAATGFHFDVDGVYRPSHGRHLRLQRSASLWGIVHAKTKFACLVCAESTNSCFAGQHRYSACLISDDHDFRVGLASSKRKFVTLKRVRKQKPIVGGSRFEGTSVFNSAKSQVNPFDGCAVA